MKMTWAACGSPPLGKVFPAKLGQLLEKAGLLPLTKQVTNINHELS
jgi:hypothetical protein